MIIANIISARNFAKRNHAWNRIGNHNVGGHSKYDKFIIKMDTTEIGFNFHETDMWFNPQVLPFDSFVLKNVLFEF